MLQILWTLLFFLLPWSIRASEERNLLQKAAKTGPLEALLIPDQQWVTYPAYQNRDGWDHFTGPLKSPIIKAGEDHLLYSWKAIPLSAYLEYERSGTRQDMETPYNANAYALNSLVHAELAEGKGRFIDHTWPPDKRISPTRPVPGSFSVPWKT